MAKKKIDCSELSIQINEIVMNLGSRDNVRSIDDAVAEMQKFPALAAITREDVITAMNEVMDAQSQTRDELTKKLSQLKREARRDKNLKQAITDLQEAVKTRKSPAPAPKPKKKATPAAILALMAKKEALQQKVDAKTDPNLDKLAKSMAKAMVEGGVSDRNALVERVLGELQQVDPGLSRRQVMDMISGYGKYSELSKEEVDVKLRDLKGQLQQLAKLEDMAAGIAPAKTGMERREMSDEERRLVQQVNEAKKQGGFEVTDPERQLKTAIDAVKRRLKNQIADLQTQIDTREKIVKTKTPSPTDAETQALEKERDQLREQYEDIFGKQGLTDAQRIEISKKAAEKTIAEYERRIAEGDFSPRDTGTKTPETPELQALREQRDRMRKQYEAENPNPPSVVRARERLAALEQHLEDGTLPETRPKPETANPALKDLQEQTAAVRKALSQSDAAVKKRLKASIDELLRKLEEGDYAPTVKAPTKMTEEIERLDYEKNMLRTEIRKRIRDMGPKTFMERVAEPFNVARSVITSVDFSAVLRQGGFIGLGHPVRAMKNLPDQFRAFGSERATVEIANSLLNRPGAPLAARAGLYMSPVDGAYGLSEKEEAYMSKWAEKIPVVRGSERAYVTFLNKLRADSFDAMVATLGRNGDVTQEEAEAIANYVNVATGRGKLYNMEQAALPLATIFFSPRLVASRFQIIAGQPLYGGSMRTRKMVAQEYGRFMVGLGIVIALGLSAGGEIEDDPRSSNFGKIRFGNTRLDPLTGLAQVIVPVARLATNETKSTMTGEILPLSGPDHRYGMTDGFDVTMNFIRSKLSPAAGAALNTWTRENYIGKNTDITTAEGIGRTASNLVIPMSIRDGYEAIMEQGVTEGTALTLLALFGFSVSTYGDGVADFDEDLLESVGIDIEDER